jgi:hypothetical protein
LNVGILAYVSDDILAAFEAASDAAQAALQYFLFFFIRHVLSLFLNMLDDLLNPLNNCEHSRSKTKSSEVLSIGPSKSESNISMSIFGIITVREVPGAHRYHGHIHLTSMSKEEHPEVSKDQEGKENLSSVANFQLLDLSLVV